MSSGKTPHWKFRGVEGQKEDTITAKWKVNGKPSGESVFRIIGSSNSGLISNR